jgi:hypothetical protein
LERFLAVRLLHTICAFDLQELLSAPRRKREMLSTSWTKFIARALKSVGDKGFRNDRLRYSARSEGETGQKPFFFVP